MLLLQLYVVASLGLSDFQSFALVVQISLKCQLGLHVWGRQQFPKCLLLHLVLDSTFWTRVNFPHHSCINVQEKLILLQVKVL